MKEKDRIGSERFSRGRRRRRRRRGRRRNGRRIISLLDPGIHLRRIGGREGGGVNNSRRKRRRGRGRGRRRRAGREGIGGEWRQNVFIFMIYKDWSDGRRELR